MADHNLYAVGQRDIVAQGQHYFNHVLHMTREGLHSKSDIAAELSHRDMEIARLTAEVDELRDEVRDDDRSSALRHAADRRAIKRWQAAHPGKELTWPDHADLCVWLLEQQIEEKKSVTLNGYDLRAALGLLAPDNTAEQLEQEVTIDWGTVESDNPDETAPVHVGYRCSLTEYPEEGSIPLDGKPDQSTRSN